jgi:gluconolactonase
MHAIRTVTEDLACPDGPFELPDGDLAVVEICTGSATRIVRHGTNSVIAQTGGGPNGAALGPDGTICVAQSGGRRRLPHRRVDAELPGAAARAMARF